MHALTDEFEGSSLLHEVDADADPGILAVNERELVTDWFPRKRHYRFCKYPWISSLNEMLDVFIDITNRVTTFPPKTKLTDFSSIF